MRIISVLIDGKEIPYHFGGQSLALIAIKTRY